MGLATIDPHSRNKHRRNSQNPQVWCLSGKFLLRYSDLKTSKFTKKSIDSVRMAIHFLVNFDIFQMVYLFYYWVYLHQTWGFCKTWSTFYDYVDQ